MFNWRIYSSSPSQMLLPHITRWFHCTLIINRCCYHISQEMVSLCSYHQQMLLPHITGWFHCTLIINRCCYHISQDGFIVHQQMLLPHITGWFHCTLIINRCCYHISQDGFIVLLSSTDVLLSSTDVVTTYFKGDRRLPHQRVPHRRVPHHFWNAAGFPPETFPLESFPPETFPPESFPLFLSPTRDLLMDDFIFYISFNKPVKQNFGIYKKINNIILVWTINKWNQNKNIFL